MEARRFVTMRSGTPPAVGALARALRPRVSSAPRLSLPYSFVLAPLAASAVRNQNPKEVDSARSTARTPRTDLISSCRTRGICEPWPSALRLQAVSRICR